MLPLITDIAVDRVNANVVYVAGGGFGGHHLYKTTNALAASPDLDRGRYGSPRHSVQCGAPRSRQQQHRLCGHRCWRVPEHQRGRLLVLVHDRTSRTPPSSISLPTARRSPSSPSPTDGAHSVSPRPAPRRRAPAQNMTVRKGTGTSLLVTYSPACGVTDHVIYWGTSPITGSVNWTNAACGRGTTGSASFDPGPRPPLARSTRDRRSECDQGRLLRDGIARGKARGRGYRGRATGRST